MSEWTLLEWITVAGVTAGIIGTLVAIIGFFRPGSGARTDIKTGNVTNSTIAGRDINGRDINE